MTISYSHSPPPPPLPPGSTCGDYPDYCDCHINPDYCAERLIDRRITVYPECRGGFSALTKCREGQTPSDAQPTSGVCPGQGRRGGGRGMARPHRGPPCGADGDSGCRGQGSPDSGDYRLRDARAMQPLRQDPPMHRIPSLGRGRGFKRGCKRARGLGQTCIRRNSAGSVGAKPAGSKPIWPGLYPGRSQLVGIGSRYSIV